MSLLTKPLVAIGLIPLHLLPPVHVPRAVRRVAPHVTVVKQAVPVVLDQEYQQRLRAELCEVKPWQFCNPEIYR